MINQNKKKWYAIYTRPRNEKKVFDSLIKKGVEAYVPLRTEIKQWSDRRKKVEIPIISSYVFIKIDYIKEREIIFTTQGFITFVNDNKHNPIIIPESEIDTMRRAIDSSLSIEVNNNLLTKGKKVKINTGPLKDIEGIITDITKHKINILLTSIGITLVTDISDAEIIPIVNN